MVAGEFANVVVNILFKAATNKGMSNYVFVVYSYAVTSIVLLPFAFIFRSRTALLPSIRWFRLLSRICLVGLFGALSRTIGFTGIAYGSPTLASLIGNSIPAFTFTLAVILRMEKLALRSSSTQAKVIGTAASITGAVIVVLYRGPTIFSSTSSSVSPLRSSPSNWIIGGILLTVENVLISICFIMQTQIVKMYPAEFVVTSLYSLSGTLISIPLCFMIEPNLSAWRLKFDVELAPIISSGFLGVALVSVIHTFALHIKGPVYAAIFRPLSIAISAIMSFIVLVDAPHLGSVIGAITICIGVSAVLWGRAKEEDTNYKTNNPLLQSLKVEDTEI